MIGHVNPDTDSIAAAMGYAWLLHERDGADVIAARAGPTNPQTNWVLKRLGGVAPVISDDGTYLADGVVSRKKQLLPAVLGLLEF